MASALLTALIEAHLPRRPYCANFKNGIRIRPRNMALQCPYLQLNPPTHCAWLVLDVDREYAGASWMDANLPAPTYVAINQENGHAHLGYALAAPVCTTDAARNAPIRYLAAIEHAYTAQLKGGDFAFSGPCAKNPLHPHWKLWEPANAPTYELSELADYVDLPTRFVPSQRGFGRNCTLFENLRRWAYSAVRAFWRPGGSAVWRDAALRQAYVLNTFSEPLSRVEVVGIARSVAKFVWRRFNPADFREVQSVRGRAGALASARAKRDRREIVIREAIEKLTIEDWLPSMRTVAKATGCSVSTLSKSYGHLWT